MKMNFRSPRRAVIATIVVATFLAVPAVLLATHSWGGYHWARTSNPFNLKVGDNVSGAWDGVLDTTISDWTQSTVLNLNKVAGQSKGRCRPTTGRVEVCNDTYGNNGWLGVAQIWLQSGTQHIVQGTVKLNDTYHNSAPYNTTAWRNLVSCQEVGHTLGLDHQDENFDNPNLGTCMDYTNDPSTNQHPNQHDYDELQIIYSHVDSTTTVGASLPSGLNQIDFEGPRQWGKLIHEAKDHSTSVYELDFGTYKVHTFVIWTLEERGRHE